MILRRFMNHVSEQNWFAVGLDVLVVITGIFLGMQVTEWNEGRKEQARSVEVMKRIGDDLQLDMIKMTHRRQSWSSVLDYATKAEAWDRHVWPARWRVGDASCPVQCQPGLPL